MTVEKRNISTDALMKIEARLNTIFKTIDEIRQIVELEHSKNANSVDNSRFRERYLDESEIAERNAVIFAQWLDGASANKISLDFNRGRAAIINVIDQEINRHRNILWRYHMMNRGWTFKHDGRYSITWIKDGRERDPWRDPEWEGDDEMFEKEHGERSKLRPSKAAAHRMMLEANRIRQLPAYQHWDKTGGIIGQN